MRCSVSLKLFRSDGECPRSADSERDRRGDFSLAGLGQHRGTDCRDDDYY